MIELQNTRFVRTARSLALLSLLLGISGLRAAESPADLDAQVDAICEKEIREGPTAGISVAIAEGDKILLAKGYGFADVENEIPATEHTVYRLGSVTKQFTAAAIMQLVEKGKVSLDDPITKFLPDYPMEVTAPPAPDLTKNSSNFPSSPAKGRRITVEHLLHHTSGIKNYTALGKKFGDVSRKALSHDELINLFKDEPLDFEPGEKWNYSNSGYYLLGVIVEKASGDSYENYLKKNVFGPLGLEATYYLSEKPIVKHRAEGYERERKALVNDEFLDMSIPYAAGSLGSTVLDLVKWQRALVSGRVVSPASYEKMIASGVLKDGDKTNYGFGLALEPLDSKMSIGHGGGINGFRTHLSYYPEDELTVVVLVNTGGSDADRITRAIARKCLALPEPALKDVAISAEDLRRYAGKYKTEGQTLTFEEKDGSLRRQLSGGSSLMLKYQGDDEFAAVANVEMRFRFKIEDGKSKSVRLLGRGNPVEAPRVAEP